MKKRSKIQKIWAGICIVMICAMVLFTILPYLK